MSHHNQNDNLKRKRSEIYPDTNMGLSKTRPNFSNSSFTSRVPVRNPQHGGMSITSQSLNKNNIQPHPVYKHSINNAKAISKSTSLTKMKFNPSLNTMSSSLNTSLNSSLQMNHTGMQSRRPASLNHTLLPSSKPRIEKMEKLVNNLNVNKQELISDFSQCNGDLNNLREAMKIKKKKDNSMNESNSETKRKIEQLSDFIRTTNSYISNVCKNYTEKYRRSLDAAKHQLLFSEESSNEEFSHQVKDKAGHFTEPKLNLHLSLSNNGSDSGSKFARKSSNNPYSHEVNHPIPFPSTGISKEEATNPGKLVNEIIKMDKIVDFNIHDDEGIGMNDSHEVQLVNEFAFGQNQVSDKEFYFKSRIEEFDERSEQMLSLDEGEIEQIEILNNKIKEKEKDFNFVIENFDLILNSQETTGGNSITDAKKQSKEDIINDFMDREMHLKKTIENVKNAFFKKAKDYETLTNSLNELMGELNRGESHRRKLHNYIQELRGNIRVYCRVKPLSNILDVFMNIF
jgi:hypothetical protein